MADYYFERYMDQATAALEGPMERVSNGDLIRAIEDIGGDERFSIARAVPAEAALVARALLAANVRDSETIERMPLSSEQDYTAFKTGWFLGELVDGAPYIAGGGTIRRENRASAMLSVDGTIYAYSRHMPTDPLANGLALNRYAPVCATSMNDRAMLHGMAVLVVHHDLEIPRTS